MPDETSLASAQKTPITADRLSRRFSRVWALADVSFELPESSVLILAGQNGSGKSTLLRILATAIRPSGGAATVHGFNVITGRDEIRRRTAYLGHVSGSYDSLTPLENLSLVARHLGKPADRTSLLLLLERVGLEKRSADLVSTFSAGMRKRLGLARVILTDASLLLLDEPYGNLDPQGFTLVDELIRESRRRGASVVMSTHQIERVSGIGDSAMVLHEGRLSWFGKASALPVVKSATVPGRDLS